MSEIHGSKWGGQHWSGWNSLEASIRPRAALAPQVAGIYRVRCRDERDIIYIGQSGSSLLKRLRQLARGMTLAAAGRPESTPHFAANCIFQHSARGSVMEVSWTEMAQVEKRERFGIECDLISLYRRTEGRNPTCPVRRGHRARLGQQAARRLAGKPDSLSISQINRLGERLRKQGASLDDVLLLNAVRQRYSSAYEVVMAALNELEDEFDYDIGGRFPKTNGSIIAKLQRENTRLSKMQDIAGCRIVVPNWFAQEELLELLELAFFPDARVDDRRERPRPGYRAVHLIVPVGEHVVEIQIRTEMQHLWAETSEALARLLKDPWVKYGGAMPGQMREGLDAMSETIALSERVHRWLKMVVTPRR